MELSEIREKIDRIDLSDLDVRVYTEYSSLVYRLDGNNVDPDTEAADLARNQLVYQGLTDAISQSLKEIKSVCK